MNIIGNGGLAKQIKDVANTIHTYSISRKGKLKAWDTSEYEDLSKPYIIGFAALDDLRFREEQYYALKQQDKEIGTIISPYATVSQDARIEEGGVVLHHAFVGPGALLDVNVLIATSAIVEHDTIVGQHSVVLTGAIINGGCHIGCRCMIGSGAVILHNVRICNDVTIGAGAVVTEDIVEPGTYVGIPAERVGVPL